MSSPTPEVESGFVHAPFAEEAEARWGQTAAFQESKRRTKRYGPADWARFQAEQLANTERLVALMRAGKPVADPEVRAAVEEHRLLIDRWFYPCPAELHRQLGAMYVADARFTATLDRAAPGFAQYLSEAIAAG